MSRQYSAVEMRQQMVEKSSSFNLTCQSVECAVGVPVTPPEAVLGNRATSFAAYALTTLCANVHVLFSFPFLGRGAGGG